ncbi:hypothetical protein ACFL49_02975 [Candidatus Omnitrophota bacterium]
MIHKINFSSREKKIFIVLSICILGFIFQAGIYKPLAHQKELLAIKIRAAEKSLFRAQRSAQNEGQQDHVKRMLAPFRQKGTDEEVMSSILSEIEQKKEGLDLRIADMKPQKMHKVDLLKVFSVRLTIEGAVTDVLQFIYLLQEPPHMFRVDEFRLGDASAKQPTLKCQLVFSRKLVEDSFE